MIDYEKLGVFYLGKRVAPETGERTEEPILYDSKDLTTHGMCVGMTGSGKTGLCLSLIEEAAIDGIPVLAIDPKGDLGNLMLTFPKLRSEDFEPWIDPGEATRKGRSVPQHAKATSELWKNGLASWQQDGARIKRLKETADFSIYTPGSQAGLPLSILKGFHAPPAAVREDFEAFTERVQSTTSSLLALLGIDADPLRSREHIFVSNLLSHHWQQGTDLTIPDLIRGVQEPPFRNVGVMDVETVFPQKDRFGLAMAMNSLLASPTFAAWGQGEPLNIQRLLWTEEGKPRVTILSIAHLPDDQRMFFVTLLLTELVSWMRQQPGTNSLRAMLYMDEVFGFLPPTANPPSKLPMMTLLKQARAFGIGCMLATQNPVDLDYKALSNMGTWFLGRLQTERDKLRVLDGLEGASAQTGASFDRKKVEAILSGMESRRFLLHNVHDEEPVLMHTRWAMSYLRGPMTRTQIEQVMSGRKKAAETTGTAGVRKKVAAAAAASPAKTSKKASQRPVLDSEIDERFQPPLRSAGEQTFTYRPALLGTASLHYVSARDDIDHWLEVHCVAPLAEEVDSNPWDDDGVVRSEDAIEHDGDPAFEDAGYAELPPAAVKKKAYATWGRRLKDHVYRTEPMRIWQCKELKESSELNESEGDFRARLRLLVREHRDMQFAKLQRKFEPKLQRIQERIRNAEQKVEEQKAQRSSAGLSAVLDVGTSILGSLFGRRRVSTGVRRAARGASRVGREAGDVKRAKEDLVALHRQQQDLDAQFEVDVRDLEDRYDADTIELNEKQIKPRKSDISIERVALLWTPWGIGNGRPTSLG
ncbi:MAG: ATP-binding protein [Planctomycetota bacterium]